MSWNLCCHSDSPLLLLHRQHVKGASEFLVGSPSRVSSCQDTILCVQALQQMHKILGQVDIVGVPFTLGSSLFEGVTSLVVAPTKAKSPEEFFDSLGRGFFILFRNAAYGIMHALGQVHILRDAITH